MANLVKFGGDGGSMNVLVREVSNYDKNRKRV